ncbi:sulfur carrier protein ThiS [Thermosynechococcaceae cyanobacterium BACA0444]|uniref:Sulfur carrier protein ThiS n=1 Tax=Pseudocalidococcus azoricus BACA0444 TaxID=2918990 RepID=A0AAE4JXC8_9CYAN|nr:sulfur carrier protein ThiS [Pseudocalidococcus azoricus]MDS3861013.1 sulfur carrier protein ThiS [Pseudocalidococcus azoricus BACA0444]
MTTTTTEHIMIHLNGETLPLPTSLQLLELLESRHLNPRLIAIEYNGEILHRQFWPGQMVQDGDRLEIVTIVGGG